MAPPICPQRITQFNGVEIGDVDRKSAAQVFGRLDTAPPPGVPRYWGAGFGSLPSTSGTGAPSAAATPAVPLDAPTLPASAEGFGSSPGLGLEGPGSPVGPGLGGGPRGAFGTGAKALTQRGGGGGGGGSTSSLLSALSPGGSGGGGGGGGVGMGALSPVGVAASVTPTGRGGGKAAGRTPLARGAGPTASGSTSGDAAVASHRFLARAVDVVATSVAAVQLAERKREVRGATAGGGGAVLLH